MAATNATVAGLQLPEGFTVRKVGKSLKVVVAKPRKAAIVETMVIENRNGDDWAEVLVASKEESAMLKAIRVTAKGYGFDWQGSLIKTIVANEKATFTTQEMYDALVGVSEGEDMGNISRIEKTLDNLVFTLGMVPVRLEKTGDIYKVKYIDRTWSECE